MRKPRLCFRVRLAPVSRVDFYDLWSSRGCACACVRLRPGASGDAARRAVHPSVGAAGPHQRRAVRRGRLGTQVKRQTLVTRAGRMLCFYSLTVVSPFRGSRLKALMIPPRLTRLPPLAPSCCVWIPACARVCAPSIPPPSSGEKHPSSATRGCSLARTPPSAAPASAPPPSASSSGAGPPPTRPCAPPRPTPTRHPFPPSHPPHRPRRRQRVGTGASARASGACWRRRPRPRPQTCCS